MGEVSSLYLEGFSSIILHTIWVSDSAIKFLYPAFTLCVCVCTCCNRNSEDGMSDEECTQVYPLVFATHRGLASAAGSFLYHM